MAQGQQSGGGGQSAGLNGEDKLALWVVVGGAALWVVGWFTDVLATLAAGGGLNTGLLEWRNGLRWSQWLDHGIVAWRAVGGADSLSRPVYFAVCVAVPAVLVALVIGLRTWRVGYRTWWGGLGKRMGGGLVKEARIATADDVRSLVVKGPTPGRVIFGTLDGKRQLAAPELRSLMVIAPPGERKTLGTVVPAVLGWKGPVIAATTKDDLLYMTGGYRQGQGPVSVYDPLGMTRAASWRCGWNPLDGCRDLSVALQRASHFVDSASGSDGSSGVEGFRHWQNEGRDLLAALFYAAAHRGQTVNTIRRWLANNDFTAMKRALMDLPEGWRVKSAAELTAEGLPLEPPELKQGKPIPREYLVGGVAYDQLNKILGANEKYAKEVVSVTASLFNIFMSPVATECSLVTTMDLDEFLDSDGTLYIVSPPGHGRDLVPLVCGRIMNIVQHVRERDLAGRPLRRPLLLCLDECANISPLKELPSITSNDRSRGIVVVSVFQTAAQIRTVWGPSVADEIWETHSVKLALGGITDADILDRISRLSGRSRVRRTSTSRGAGGVQTSQSDADEAVISPEQIRMLPEGRGLALVSRFQPVLFRQRLTYKDPALRALSEIPLLAGVGYHRPATADSDETRDGRAA